MPRFATEAFGRGSYRLMLESLDAMFLNGDCELESFKRISESSPYCVNRGRRVGQEPSLRRPQFGLSLVPKMWRPCHETTAFLTDGGGRAFQEAVGKCVWTVEDQLRQ